ncbi:hypothetical protein D3C80_1045200 [compost metagenome]
MSRESVERNCRVRVLERLHALPSRQQETSAYRDYAAKNAFHRLQIANRLQHIVWANNLPGDQIAPIRANPVVPDQGYPLCPDAVVRDCRP